MWPFNRKKSDETVPPEVQDYYNAEKRERMGLAWILAFVTLAVTVLVVLGLFFGGRWAYRKITQKDKPIVTTVQAPQSPPSSSNSGNNSSSGSSGPTRPSGNQGSTPPPAPSGSATNAPASQTSPPQGSNVAATPNTGPGDTLGVFVVATAVGIGLYQLRLRRQLKQGRF